MGKCERCAKAYIWKRTKGRELYRMRCHVCGAPLEQTSSALKRLPWFNLDQKEGE